jgi:EAL domain-containing protein (putative c-di-GMP-specific phosphodiesterase class I)/DNA-binding NarL/FixJ family response regulator
MSDGHVHNATAKGTRIILLDDDPLMLLLLSRMLKLLGCKNVMACSKGEEALQQLGSDGAPVDLILLDINMPEMDGVEFIRRLVACRYTGSLVMVSGEGGRVFDSVARLIEAHQLKALGHLHKPVQLDQLAKLLQQLKPNADTGLLQCAQVHAYDAEELREAIADGQLVNHYQPKVSLETGDFIGAECLVRWQHPQDGLVYPDAFIGLAVEQGLIADLTQAVVSAALQQIRSWRRAGHIVPVAVNITMDDLVALDFPDVMERLAGAAGVEASQLMLEVTEGQMLRSLSTVLDVLSRLQLKRFQLAIDDFGTGHSSLAQLRDLPFDELKIDRGFVHGATSDTTRQAICIASIRMAHQLRMQVVAEGIETREEWDLMRHLGCDIGQGYFIARPMPATALLSWIDEWRSQWDTKISLGT